MATSAAASHARSGDRMPLAGARIALGGGGVAHRYAAHLLASLGATPLEAADAAGTPAGAAASAVPTHPAARWAASGSMWVTGRADEAPRLAPTALADAAEGCRLAFAALAPHAAALPEDGAALLAERAAAHGHERAGARSPGGTCRLLRARDGHLALNLARADDRTLLPAWLADAGGAHPQRLPAEADADDPWAGLEAAVAAADAAPLVERARWLGLPAAMATPPASPAPAWVRVERLRAPGPVRRAARLLDLSALWAGPLCASLLADAGAEAVKIESTRRPDGARAGPPAFFDLLNAGKRSVALDLRETTELDRLHSVLAWADVVIEASRPRALQQLGVDADTWLQEAPGRVWVSLTGYGRCEPEANWVAFGDDAGVAAGLAEATGDAGQPLFCGDAIADPLAGLHAAVAAQAALRGGGGVRVEVSLCDATAHVFGFDAGIEARAGVEVSSLANGAYAVAVGETQQPVERPRLRRPRGRARPLGADTDAVLRAVDAC